MDKNSIYMTKPKQEPGLSSKPCMSEAEIMKKEIIDLTNKNYMLVKENKDLQEKVESISKKYSKLKKQNNELLEKVKKYEALGNLVNIPVNPLETNENDPSNPTSIMQYDCILDIENFYDLSSTGWNVVINDELIKTDILGSTLSIVGMYDKGKTFILNKLTNSEFGSSKKVTTKGLSFKRVDIDQTKFIIIDTAGFNSPINIKKMQEREKKYTEAFIQELAFGLSDYFIIVVNDFTAKDQKFLRSLMKKNESNKERQSIIVIHNFKDVESKDLHDYAWESQVVSVFQSEDENGAQNLLVSIGTESLLISLYKTRFSTHFSLVNDKSLYGKHYNRFAIECIKQTLKYQIMSSKQENLYNNLKINIEKALSMEIQLVPDDSQMEELNSAQNTLKEIVKPLREISEEEFKTSSFRLIRVDEFEPLSDLVTTDDYYQIYLDVPGMNPDEIEIICNNEETRVRGNRKKEHEQAHQSIHRKFGQFDLSFKVPKKFNQEYDDVNLENGVLVARFDKAKIKAGPWFKKK